LHGPHSSALSLPVRTNRFLFLICAATAPALINLPATEPVSQTAKKPVSNERNDEAQMTNQAPNAQMTKWGPNMLFVILISLFDICHSSFDFDFRHFFPSCEENC
jgi:choline-glycine betaine transporter